MAQIEYTPRSFNTRNREIIDASNAIAESYKSQGLKLTLRQLYYRLVVSNTIENNAASYDRLGALLSAARLAGEMDWDAIEDRTRNAYSNSHWSTPAGIIESAAWSYQIDKWADQKQRPEVWVEKDALASVVARVAGRHDVTYMACKGYMSQSEMHDAALRFIAYHNAGQTPVLIHLGDHDPSGIDMTRDITDRLERFIEYHTGNSIEVRRIALNMDQVKQYDPKPQPAKKTDTRVESYVRKYGASSWELDALEPTVLDTLIESAIVSLRDDTKWAAAVRRENRERAALQDVSKSWPDVLAFMESRKTPKKRATAQRPDRKKSDV